jgi:hypothetical protein
MADQQQKIISLLETAHKLAMDEGTLIERALDEARANMFPLKQAPYFPG